MSSIPAPRQEVFEMEVDSGFLPKTGDALAWGASLGVHIIALIALGMIHYEVLTTSDAVIDSSMVEEVEPMQYKFETTADDQIGNDSDLNTLTASRDSASQVGDRDPVKDLEEQVDAKFEVPVPITDSIPQPSQAEFTSVIQTRGATEHPGGVEGAVDRLAWEIANSLREGKTLVVWCFDVSPSLKKRREAIADRVENVYKQLTALNVNSDKALTSAVVSFSDKYKFVTPEPVTETEEVVEAVRSIESESSGDENVFSAVYAAANKWLSHRQKNARRMMMVVVTDERGSDADAMLEKTIAITKKYGIRCYIVGDAALFGRDKIETPFVLESGEEVIGVMESGPETMYADLVRLPYWGINSGGLEQMSSGFGPYALTRLAAETNGLYLIAKESGRQRFDPQVMRDYAPDYRPKPVIDKDIGKNKAKQSLLTVAQMALVNSLPTPLLEFPAENDTVLRLAITEAQKPVADLDYKLQAYQAQLEQAEKDRPKIAEARWQVAYDLAMGRVLALRARCYGYNLMLAEMKVNPKKFETQGSNRWRLVPSNKVDSGQAVKKMVAKTNDYLNRVIDQHNGTPWQILAEREKGAPLGWEWKEETYTPPPANAGGDGDGKRGPRFIEERDPKTGKVTRRQLPAQPVRKDI